MSRSTVWSHACGIAWLWSLLAGSVVFAERLTINPETRLSLDFKVEGTTACILIPQQAYDEQACAGIPREEVAAPQGRGQNVRALVILRQPERVFVLTVASIPRPGIGQMYDRQLQGFVDGTLKNLSQEFGASTHLVDGKAPAYTLEKVGGVPVARWEYTTDLPEADSRANTASAVVYLIPSRDTLDILSLNAHQRDLEAARSVGARIISTMQVPLTIDVEAFGGDMSMALGMDFAKVLVPAALVLLVVGWMGWRYRKARRG
ncbi:hypothetical protein [Hyalangium gracile]|uniref:hypothetical protein n=1 Tax=Hyalangium gracile TaxID=394092 RepID=UPI001CCC64E7|nr:hypothetical protein [Hyalangium gracile]